MIAFGFIGSESDYNNLSQDQQEQYRDIITPDDVEL